MDSWDEDTPLKRVEATVKADLEYLNGALENSEIPIRYVTWGSVQDIERTDAQIGQKDYLEVFDEYVFSILRNLIFQLYISKSEN